MGEEIDQEKDAVLYLCSEVGLIIGGDIPRNGILVSSEVGLMVGGSSHAGGSILKLHDKEEHQHN